MSRVPFDERRVRELVRQCRNRDIFPMFIPQHRADPPTSEISRIIHDLVTEAVSYLEPMTDTEVVLIAHEIGGWTCDAHSFAAPLFPRHPKVVEIALNCVCSAVAEHFVDISAAIANPTDGSTILAQYPELTDHFDKDGLLSVDASMQPASDGIFYKDHVLHYHQFLRRGYSSRPNMDFLGALTTYHRQTSSRNTLRLAVDHSRLMERKHYRRMIEMDRWYGPPFDSTTLDDPGAVGVTVHARNKESLFELTNSLDFTDFFWSFRDGIKTFELEEVSSVGYKFDRYYLNRYVHSERDIALKAFRHLDGAVKVYLSDEYVERTASHLPGARNCWKKIKLFRLDGDVELDHWTNIIAMFLKGNEMVIEYFDPKVYEQMFDLRIRNPKAWKALQTNE